MMKLLAMTSSQPESARRAQRFGEDCIETVIQGIMQFVGYKNYMSDVQCLKMAAALRVMADEFERNDDTD